ncbi:MAG: hypothetical protein ACLP9L_28140 [Thermoguttaceae bacterium]
MTLAPVIRGCLERAPLGTPYPEVVERVVEVTRSAQDLSGSGAGQGAMVERRERR